MTTENYLRNWGNPAQTWNKIKKQIRSDFFHFLNFEIILLNMQQIIKSCLAWPELAWPNFVVVFLFLVFLPVIILPVLSLLVLSCQCQIIFNIMQWGSLALVDKYFYPTEPWTICTKNIECQMLANWTN